MVVGYGFIRGRLLGIVIVLPSFALGGLLSFWLVEGLMVLISRGSWSAVTAMPTYHRILPSSAPWFTETEQTLWNVGGIAAIIVAGITGYWGQKFWRYLVVAKFKWATSEQVDEFLKNSGDGPGYGQD